MKINTPTDLLFDQLRDLLSMESLVAKAIPLLAADVTNVPLRDLLTRVAYHSGKRRDQLADIFPAHGETPGHDVCRAMKGVLEGGESHLGRIKNPAIRDVMILAHCMRITHYNIAAYGITSRLAERIGLLAESKQFARFSCEEEIAGRSLKQLEPEIFEAADQALGSHEAVLPADFSQARRVAGSKSIYDSSSKTGK